MQRKILLYFLFFTFISFGQTYQPIDTTDYEIRQELKKKYEAANKATYKKLKKEYSGKFKKEIISIYKGKHEEFLRNIQKKRFIFDKRFTNYTDSLATIITKQNPELTNSNLTFYVSKNPTINAMSIGEGIIILNLGLFKYLENDAQLASVVGHEIAHQKLRHVKNMIEKRARLNTSKTKKSQAKKIRKQRYNTYDKAFKLMRDLLYSDTKEKREHEAEADAIGYSFYKKTSLPKSEFINALALLGKYDSLPEISIDSTIYKRLFNLPTQPFKDEWLSMEEFSDYDYSKFKEKMNKDSLKTHPEIEERIKKLKQRFPELSNNNNKVEPSITFKTLQGVARQEDIANLFFVEKYGSAIKLALYKLQKNPDDNYVKEWLGKNFLALYEAKKKYQMNRHIERIVPKDQSKNHQQFLNFIWNLNLDELKTIGDFYTKKED